MEQRIGARVRLSSLPATHISECMRRGPRRRTVGTVGVLLAPSDFRRSVSRDWPLRHFEPAPGTSRPGCTEREGRAGPEAMDRRARGLRARRWRSVTRMAWRRCRACSKSGGGRCKELHAAVEMHERMIRNGERGRRRRAGGRGEKGKRESDAGGWRQ